MTLHSLSKNFPVAVVIVILPIFIGLFSWLIWLAPTTDQLVVIKPNPFTPLKLEARSAVVYDPTRNVILYAKNKDETLPIASLTKLMTSYLAKKSLPAGSTITTSDGKVWQLKDLLDLTLVTSSNDGAEHLAAATALLWGRASDTFPYLMNEEAVRLGLFHTRFTNPTGLDIEGKPSAESTAFEVARLLAYLVENEPDLLSATSHSNVFIPAGQNFVLATNTNTGTNYFPGLIASKTGFTRNAGGSLAIAFDAGLNQPLIAVVLGSSETGRVEDARKLALAAIEWASYEAK